MQRLETPSLLLEPLTRDDYPWLFVLYADPEVMRYIGTGVRGEEQSRKTLDGQLAQGERLGFGYWVIRDRQDRSPLGGGMLVVRQEGAPVELGFLLERAAWGRGIASEAARALLDHALGPLGLPEVQAFTDPANEASMAVLRKAGMRDAGLTTGPYGSSDRKFLLTRSEWLATAR
jgi:RimJ/RimL family protein N-acetyltransferase